MEEEEDDAWRGISLSLSHNTNAHHRPLRGLDLQDFFSRPSNKDPPTTTTPDDFFRSSFPPPTTVLSLSSASSDQIHCRSPSTFKCSVSNALFRKSTIVKDDGSSSDGDRLKRLMRNREAGDRSRARKQVYLEKLEKQYQHLKEENARIRKQLERWGAAGEASCDNQLPEKHTLRRTLTSPF